MPGIRRIIGSRYLRPLLDQAASKVHLPAFRQRHPTLRGTDIIIGIVDSGLDTSHPAFAGRVLRLWDQTLSGPGVPEGGYGTELTGVALTRSQDTHGHGTHVAGIAAGADPTFGGVAPAATLVIVKTDFQDAHIADGVRYVFRVARDLNRRAVVNLSLGGHQDAHDGTDSLSAIIDTESGPGRIVCCAAGNEGNDSIHGQMLVAAQTQRRMRFRVPSNSIGLAELNGWYAAAQPLEVAVQTPGGFVTPFQAVMAGAGANPTQSYALPDARVRITTPGPDPANRALNFHVQCRGIGLGTAVRGGVWQLLLRHPNSAGGTVQVDVWTLNDQEAPQVVWSGTSARDTMKIGLASLRGDECFDRTADLYRDHFCACGGGADGSTLGRLSALVQPQAAFAYGVDRSP